MEDLCVCNVGRLKSLEPFARHLNGFEMMNMFDVTDNDSIIGKIVYSNVTFKCMELLETLNCLIWSCRITHLQNYFLNVLVKGSDAKKLIPIIKRYKSVLNEKRLMFVSFTTLFDYLWLLRGICEKLSVVKSRCALYLAAAVSDFYIPLEQLVRNLSNCFVLSI